MKKKKFIWGIVAVVVGLGIAGMMGSDESTPKSASTVKEEATAEEVSMEDTEQVSESEIVEEVQEPEATENVSDGEPDDYFEVGETFSNDNLRITALDIGLYENPGGDMYGFHFMYVLTEVENISKEVQDIYQDSTIYIDDYQYESTYIYQITVDGVNGNATQIQLNPGRKCKYIYYTSIPEDAFNADRVEFVIYDSIPVIFKDGGSWLYGNGSDTAASNYTLSDGIGNPIIDADPDQYIPEGITGEIDVIDDGFYADSGNIDLVPGEYIITGGASAILTITEHTISMSGGKNNFENAEIKPAENGSPQYWVYVDGNYYAVVSFFDGGLYFRTDEADGEEDWDEGFYSKF